jgi:hypothetical protein
MMYFFLTATAVLMVYAITPVAATENLKFDSNDRLTRNSILYQDTPYCLNKLKSRWNSNNPYAEVRNFVAISPQMMEKFVESGVIDEVETKCLAVCVDVGLAKDLIPYPIPFYVYKEHSLLRDAEKDNVKDLNEFIDKCKAAEVGFISYYPKEAQVYWLNTDGKRHDMGILRYGERNTLWQRTFLGHVFEICDKDTDELLERHTVKHHAHVVVGHAYQVESVNKSIHSNFNFEQVNAKVKQAMSHEWTRCNRVKRTYTPLGFSKGRLPNDIWGSISAFQYNNKDNGMF